MPRARARARPRPGADEMGPHIGTRGGHLGVGIGVLYLGFLPKLSYAALAGVAAHLDGRACLGQAQPERGLHQVSFAGPMAVVWHDSPGAAVRATRLGCLPDEPVVVRDMLGNHVASGKAGRVHLGLSRGPIYLVGSRQLAGIARAERAVRVRPKEVALPPTGSAQVDVALPPNAKVSVDLPPARPSL